MEISQHIGSAGSRIRSVLSFTRRAEVLRIQDIELTFSFISLRSIFYSNLHSK